MIALSEFADDIIALEQLRGGSSGLADWDALQKGFAGFWERAGVDKDEVPEAVPDRIWEQLEADLWTQLGSHLLEREKKAIPIRLRLTRLYEQLAKASPDEWEAYAKLLNRALVGSLRQSWPQLAQRMNETT